MSSSARHSTSRLLIGFEPGDGITIAGVSYQVDTGNPAFVTVDGIRHSLADGAVVEMAPGFYAQVTARPHLGPFVIGFWGEKDVGVVRRRPCAAWMAKVR